MNNNDDDKKENVIEFMNEICDDIRNKMEMKVYNNAIEIGKSNTIKSLLYANVNDIDTIVFAVRKVWNIEEKEIEKRIAFEKNSILIEKIKSYLRVNGYSEDNIRNFFNNNSVILKIKGNLDLWKLKDNPEELIKAIIER